MAGDARSLQRSRAPDTDSASLSLEDVELGGMDMKREATYASPDESQRRHAEETAGGGRGIKRTGQIVKPPTRLHVALRKVDNYAVVSGLREWRANGDRKAAPLRRRSLLDNTRCPEKGREAGGRGLGQAHSAGSHNQRL